MTKLCPRGKAAAKRKFKVYPSAYANAYASKICAGKIKDPSGVKRKDFKGPKPASAKDGKFMNEIEIERQKRETKKRNIRREQNRLMEKREKLRENQGSRTGTKAKVNRKFPYKGPGVRVTRDDGTSTFYSDTPEGFSVGGHSVMGSPISVDVDGDNLTNASASAYYKDLLK
jgi:hypothetical protein